jgi:glycosyltransferase involved in cell wall biosynthesis
MIHDNLPISQPQYFPEGTANIHERWLRAIVTSADQILCISQDVADQTELWLEEHKLALRPPPKFVVLHHGADLGAASPTNGLSKDAAALLDELSARPTFLMVGTIEPRKGYLQTLDAFEILWADGIDINLVIVGTEGWQPVPQHKRRNIPQIVARLRKRSKTNRHLFWLNGTSDEYLDRLYTASVCLIAASEGEGFGLPLIEAAKHGLPIIARDIPVFREVAGEYAAYFAGMHPTDLAGAIKSWLALYVEGRHPKSARMPWITWAENVKRLKEILVTDARSVGLQRREKSSEAALAGQRM